MKKKRQLIMYNHYFDDFFVAQSQKVKDKIMKIFEIIELIDRIPETYLKHIQDGLFEIRVQFGGDIFRIFCFFDSGQLVVLLTGFQKKTQKTPASEKQRALRLMNEYYNEKNKQQ